MADSQTLDRLPDARSAAGKPSPLQSLLLAETGTPGREFGRGCGLHIRVSPPTPLSTPLPGLTQVGPAEATWVVGLWEVPGVCFCPHYRLP